MEEKEACEKQDQQADYPLSQQPESFPLFSFDLHSKLGEFNQGESLNKSTAKSAMDIYCTGRYQEITE